MHQRRAVRAEFAFGPVQPQHGLALALGDRFAALPAIDIFPGRIDRARAALGLFPVALERPPGLILRLVDLAMGMQASERIVADRTQGNDLLARLQRQGIVDLDGCDFGIAQQIARPSVMRLGGIVRLSAFGFRHLMGSLKTVEFDSTGKSIRLIRPLSPRAAVRTIRPGGRSPPAEARSTHADERSDGWRGSRFSLSATQLTASFHAASANRSETMPIGRLDRIRGSNENAGCNSSNPAGADDRRR